MTNINHFKIQQLVNERCRAKALIKYEIKQIENRLQKAMGDGKSARLRIQDAAQFCSELSLKYENLLYLLKPDYQESDIAVSISENSPSRCYVMIQTLKQQICLPMELAEETKIVRKLKYYYKYLQEQLNGLHPQSVEYIQRSLTGQLKTLVEAKSSADWLYAIVAFANNAGENILSSLALVAQVDDKEMLMLASLFERPEITLIINHIFFYKLNPHQLFKQALHPEKLLSVKARLSMLHQFIESIHQTVLQALKQRGIGELHDYLFHGEEELPQGITINIENETQHLIITALKEWRLPNIVLSEEIITKSKLNDFFRAYKFWFNPNRLIDTAMALRQQLGHCSESHESYKKFFQDMQDLFKQLATTECLDLYGYFANKDSCYLMRTLAAMLEDQKIAALPLATPQQKDTIARVYQVLDCVMEAVREELSNRSITTTPYARHSTHKPLKPGRRNINAITRIMNLYSGSIVLENQTLEQLFKEVGGNL
ncbi:hypothetical protein [Legionella cardiaca]|uniref:Uncharacterized protein n=1 Tax=Legionella cardiaca TaxID=1071983 RepID=A0ABY8ASN3_9GAMM|nr:hypothetical protein [Legionella cardiaca]WED42520.1 hypothetical protein PXX05_11445 [Legionella cardiaca]